MSKNKNGLTIIVGCGTLGSRIANEVYNEDANVIVIDRHEGSFDRLDSSFGGMTITGDGCDFEILEKANIKNAECVIAVTQFDNNNIFIGEVAKEMYGVKNVIARIQQNDVADILEKRGIIAVCPAEISAKAILDAYDGGGKNE